MRRFFSPPLCEIDRVLRSAPTRLSMAPPFSRRLKLPMGKAADPYRDFPMHHHPARVIVTILVVALVATSFGSAAEGKRTAEVNLTSTTTAITAASDRARWCASLSNSPAMLEEARKIGDHVAADQRWLELLEAAARGTASGHDARTIGSLYSSLGQRWLRWDGVCRGAYLTSADARSAGT